MILFLLILALVLFFLGECIQGICEFLKFVPKNGGYPLRVAAKTEEWGGCFSGFECWVSGRAYGC